MKLPLLAAVALAVLTAGAARAEILLDITNGDIGIPASNPDGMLGFDFRLDSDQAITALGIWDEGSDGLAHDHVVKLWTTSGTLLASAVIDNASTPIDSLSTHGRWLFTPITPILVPFGEYVLAAQYIGGDADVIRAFSSIFIFPSPGVTYMNTRFGVAGSNNMPEFFGISRGHFGPNLQFADASIIPEPVTAAVFAVAALVTPRRRPHR